MRENDFMESPIGSPASVVSMWSESKKKPNSKLRHAIGIALLLATVFLWTASNFLASVRSPTFGLEIGPVQGKYKG
jgi:solute carrier family 35 protein F5